MRMNSTSDQAPFPVGYQEIDRQLCVAEVHQDRFRNASIRLCLVLPVVIAIDSLAWLLSVNRLLAIIIGVFSLGFATLSFCQWWRLGTIHLVSVQASVEPLRQYWHVVAYKNGWRHSAYAEDILDRFCRFEIAEEGNEWGRGPGSLPLRINSIWLVCQPKRK